MLLQTLPRQSSRKIHNRAPHIFTHDIVPREFPKNVPTDIPNSAFQEIPPRELPKIISQFRSPRESCKGFLRHIYTPRVEFVFFFRTAFPNRAVQQRFPRELPETTFQDIMPTRFPNEFPREPPLPIRLSAYQFHPTLLWWDISHVSHIRVCWNLI